MVTEVRRGRVIIARVSPEIDGGHYAVKRVAGDTVRVEADVFADGHEVLVCTLLHRAENAEAWAEVPMTAAGNDRWHAEFPVAQPGRYLYTVRAWLDRFGIAFGWRHRGVGVKVVTFAVVPLLVADVLAVEEPLVCVGARHGGRIMDGRGCARIVAG